MPPWKMIVESDAHSWNAWRIAGELSFPLPWGRTVQTLDHAAIENDNHINVDRRAAMMLKETEDGKSTPSVYRSQDHICVTSDPSYHLQGQRSWSRHWSPAWSPYDTATVSSLDLGLEFLVMNDAERQLSLLASSSLAHGGFGAWWASWV